MTQLRPFLLILLLLISGMLPISAGTESPNESVKGRDLAIIVDFPEKPIKIPHYRSFWYFYANLFDFDRDGYTMVGHTAIILVNGTTGDLEYFDFGRYDDRNDLMGPRPEFYGTVRSARHVPQLALKIKARIENDWIQNLDSILIQLAIKPLLRDYDPIDFAVVPNLKLGPMMELARKYEDEGFIYYGAPAHLYCTSFVRKLIRRGGNDFGLLNFTGQQTISHVRKKIRQPYD
ncbi:MAG: DUF6695 family protein [Bacteroidales bacterium]